jgi:hypothetical protein
MDQDRYGELTDEIEQMASPEREAPDDTVIVCGKYAASLYIEMLRYLINRN